MAIDTEKYSNELHKLCDDFYFHDISQAEYVQRRNDIFERMEKEMTTGVRYAPGDRNALHDIDSLAEDVQYGQD